MVQGAEFVDSDHQGHDDDHSVFGHRILGMGRTPTHQITVTTVRIIADVDYLGDDFCVQKIIRLI